MGIEQGKAPLSALLFPFPSINERWGIRPAAAVGGKYQWPGTQFHTAILFPEFVDSFLWPSLIHPNSLIRLLAFRSRTRHSPKLRFRVQLPVSDIGIGGVQVGMRVLVQGRAQVGCKDEAIP